jgi:hypothetical protein
MGFGTLFFGYFLLLNITYYSITDLISALIMAMGLYKLSSINIPFKNGFYSSLVFAVIGLFELCLEFISVIAPTMSIIGLSRYIQIPRYFMLAVLTSFILLGIQNVAEEVELAELSRRAQRTLVPMLSVYALSAVLEVPLIKPLVSIRILSVTSFILLLATLTIVAINLITIYRAYMKICMPDDKDNGYEEKPSKFQFINKHREHTQQKQREYAEYKLERLKKKATKKKK